MTQALTSAVAEATKLPPDEQDVLAAILIEEWKGLGKTDAMDLVNTFNPRSSECHQYRNVYSPASIARKP